MADGKTYIEAVQNAEIAMDEWIEAARLMERVIPASRENMFMRRCRYLEKIEKTSGYLFFPRCRINIWRF